MFWTVLLVLLLLWLLGLISNIGGSMIHILLLLAVVVLFVNMRHGRRASGRR